MQLIFLKRMKPKIIFNFLKSKDIKFFTGVPDSLLKDFIYYIDKNVKNKNHISTANEGLSLSLAAGYFLATNKIPLVYLQNSGLGNLINPLLSLTDKLVYSIPALIMIGWRGDFGKNDEPQHIAQGSITPALIKLCRKKYFILNGKKTDIKKISLAITLCRKLSEPVFLIVKKNSFKDKNKIQIMTKNSNKYLNREELIKLIIKIFSKKSKIISTTGMISRELYENTSSAYQKNNFYSVGSMGHASQIALGYSLNSKKKNVICLDGDGALLMHMGSLITNGNQNPSNLIHILINNFSHDSVGGQRTAAGKKYYYKFAKLSGYKYVYGPLIKFNNIKKCLENVLKKKRSGSVFIEVLAKKGNRSNIGRPKDKLILIKKNFMNKI